MSASVGSPSGSYGARITIAGQGARFLVQIAGIAILGRLIAPSEFGLLAMITSVVGIAYIVGDFGLSLAAIQAERITDRQKTNLFWINAAVGLVLSIVVFASAPWLGNLFNSPDLDLISRVLSPIFFISGLAVQFRVEVNRRLDFVSMAVVETAAPAMGLLAGVSIAVHGEGVWALVAQQLITALGILVLYMVCSKWFPTWPKRGESLRSFFGFSVATTLTQLVNYISTNADSVAIGKFLGSTQLGYYNRAFQMFTLPLAQLAAPLTRVALPILSRHSGRDSFEPTIIRIQTVLSYVLTTALVLICINSSSIVVIVLGPQWKPSATVLEILCIGGIFQALGYSYYWIFLALARTRILFFCELTGRLVMVSIIWASASRGIEWVAAAYSLGLFLIWSLTTVFGIPRTGVSSASLVLVSLRPLSVAAIVLSAMYALDYALPTHLGPMSLFMIHSSVYFVIASVIYALVPVVRRDVALVVRSVLPRSLFLDRPN